MFGTWLLCCTLLAGEDAPRAPATEAVTLSAAELAKTYEEAKAQAKRDPDAHVRLALWCAEHGMLKERDKHLSMALMINPRHAHAREILGLAKPAELPPAPAAPPAPVDKPHEDSQAGPTAPEEAAQATALAEYNAKVAQLRDTADAHWQLAVWCEQKGLKAEAATQLTRVVQLDPTREAAWKRLGYKKHNGRWMTDEQVAAEKAEVAAQRKADRHWKPLLEKWKSWLANPAKRTEAETSLAGVTDPRAVPSVWQTFGAAGHDLQRRAVQVLGQIKAPNSSRMLAVLAISGKSDEVRRRATEVLRSRDAMEFVDLWIAMLRDPLKYEVRPVGGPGSPGAILVEGKEFNVQRLYAPPSMLQTMAYYSGPHGNNPVLPLQFNSPPMPPPGSVMVGTKADGTGLYWHDDFLTPPPGAIPKVRSTPDPSLGYQQLEQAVIQQMLMADWLVSETQKMAAGSAMSQKNDVDAIERYNDSVRNTNERVSSALAGVTGQSLGADREAWTKWWKDQRGYAYEPPKKKTKATVLLAVPLPYAPATGPPIVTRGGGGGGGAPGWCLIYDHHKDAAKKMEWWMHGTCFAAGTLVQTPTGPRAIESLRAGDLVSSQPRPDASCTAAAIAAVHTNESAATLRLLVGEETINTTPGHPFWRVGQGWSRASDLQPGDLVSTQTGSARVAATEAGPSAPVFNLRLEGESHIFFVGHHTVLVHDDAAFEAKAVAAAR